MEHNCTNIAKLNIPAGYELYYGNYPDAEHILAYVCPRHRSVVINRLASQTANMIQLLFD